MVLSDLKTIVNLLENLEEPVNCLEIFSRNFLTKSTELVSFLHYVTALEFYSSG